MGKKNKNGSVLLLSLLILSTLLSSVLYVNTISTRQIIRSISTDNAIVAFYGADSGNDQAIYYIRKTEIDINDLANEFEFEDSDILLSREITDEIYGVSIGLNKDQFFQIDMFDREDLGYNSKISYLELDWQDNCAGNSYIELTVNERDSNFNINWGTGVNQSHIKKSLLNEPPYNMVNGNEINSIGGSSLIAGRSYQFRIRSLYCDLYNVNLKAYSFDGKLIPFKNIYNIKTLAEHPRESNKSNKQALSVNLKKYHPLSGLFDYVIFSEKSIVKDIGAYTGGWFSEDLYISDSSILRIALDTNYNHTLTPVNGVPEYTWSHSGTLPMGIEFNNGNLSGIAVSAGNYPNIFKVKDSKGQEVSKSILLVVQ
ncbi:hypothetical protein K8R66_04725 [bacterium]|nr:hypothetical protein [bacterium]